MVSLMARDKSRVWVIGFADWIDSFIGTIDLASPKKSIEQGFPSDSPVSNPLDAFFERRINAMNDAGNHIGTIGEATSTFQFRFYGVVPHPHGGGYFAFLNTLVTETQLRYVLTSSTRFQISFQPMCIEEYGSKGKQRMGPPEPALFVDTLPDATQGSAESIWWKVKALSNSVKSPKQRPIYIKNMIEELENYASDHHREALFNPKHVKLFPSNMGVESFAKALHADITRTFFLSKFYNVLRLLIHLKSLALLMQQAHIQMHEKELANIAENSYTAGSSRDEEWEEHIFGEDISRFESDVEKHTQAIMNELCFVVLYYCTKRNSELKKMERVIVESYLGQLNEDLEKQRKDGLDSLETENNRFNYDDASYTVLGCEMLVKRNRRDDKMVSVPGDGFTEDFYFADARNRFHIFSKRGYPWSE